MQTSQIPLVCITHVPPEGVWVDNCSAWVQEIMIRLHKRTSHAGRAAVERTGLDRPSNFDGCTPARYKTGLRPGKILRMLAVAGGSLAWVRRMPERLQTSKLRRESDFFPPDHRLQE